MATTEVAVVGRTSGRQARPAMQVAGGVAAPVESIAPTLILTVEPALRR